MKINSLEIVAIDRKEIWEDFLKEIENKTFLQSWNWGEFQKMMGERVFYLGVSRSGKLIAVALTIKVRTKRGSFLLVPHGPIIKKQKTKDKKQGLKFDSENDNLRLKTEILTALLKKLKEVVKEEKANFIRIAPLFKRNKENIELFRKLEFREAPIHVHAESTWQLNIRSSEEELLKNMRKTTRYLIKKAQKNKDIIISQSEDLKDIELFFNLHKEVSLVQHFTPFSFSYLKNEFLAFLSDKKVSLFLGRYKGEIIASAFVIFFQNKGFYHHAALSPSYSKIPIAYLILWEAIKEAKKRGCSYFDFWGYVSPRKHPSHPWAGPSLFKMGFGGKPKYYLKTQDLPISYFYWLNWLIEKIRRIRRRL